MRKIRPLSNFEVSVNVVIISQDELFTQRAFKAVQSTLRNQGVDAELHAYHSFLELLNSGISENIFILSEEAVLNDLEDLIYLKTCRNKFTSCVIMHAYEKFQPAIMEDGIINVVDKFVKKDSNLEFSIQKSINNLEFTFA